MPTESQINANRLNAQKSTGPRTPQGKAKVSQNAVTHGLTSKRPVLDIEDTDEFRQFTTELIDCLAPTNPLESFFAERAACMAWRVQRAQSYETLILNNLIKNARDKTNPNDEMGGTAKRLVASKQREDGSLTMGYEDGHNDPNSLLGHILLDDFRTHRTLEKISRYESRLENSMLRCFKQFEKLRQNRITNSHTQYQSVKTNPINVGQASPHDIKYDKTNPNSVGEASVLHYEFEKTNPIAPQIMTQETLNLLKIPA